MSPRREHESVSASLARLIHIQQPFPTGVVCVYERLREREKERRHPHKPRMLFAAFIVSQVDSHRGTIPFTVVMRGSRTQ